MRKLGITTALALTPVLVASACGGANESTPTSATSTTLAVAPPTSATVSPTTATSLPPTPVPPTSTTAAPPLFTKTSGIEYADARQLDVYAPSEPGSWPVVVVVHGLGQSKGQFASLAEAIASEGAVVFNISTTFRVPPLEAIEDIACAVRFARAKAPDYGGNPTSISIVGNSSGAAKGSIVAMDGDAYEGDCVVTEGSALPDVLVGYEGPYDYATHLYGFFDVPRLQEEDRETWEAVNPYSHIGGNQDLVVRLIHGRDEDVGAYDVLPEVSADFHQALTEAGYDVELTFIEGGHGGLGPGTEAFAVAVRQVMEAARG